MKLENSLIKSWSILKRPYGFSVGKLAVSINSYGNVGINIWKLSWYASWVQK